MTSKPSEHAKGNGPGDASSPSDLEGSPCVVCRVGTLHRGTSTSTFERGDSIIVIRGVPGWICDSCGEAYHASAVSERLLALARSATRRGAEVEILRYSASDEDASSVAA